MSIIKTPDLAEKAYDILVDECSADPANRASFCAHHSDPLHNDQDLSEWRFGGCLGNGGKFKHHHGSYYVACYHEDRTSARNAAIERANLRLSLLFRNAH